jgi:hypothetical protein
LTVAIRINADHRSPALPCACDQFFGVELSQTEQKFRFHIELEDNLQTLEVKLSASELGRLDALTKPTFGFPQSMQPLFAAIHNGGTSVNGVSAPPSPFGVEKGDKIY